MPPSSFSEVTVAMLAVCLAFMPLASVGLAVINTGLGRSRSAAHAMTAAVYVMAIATLVFFIWGYSLAGHPGGPSHGLTIAGRAWSWLGSEPFFLRGIDFNDSPRCLAVLFQLFAAGLAATIPLGSGVDRWRLAPSGFMAAAVAGITYPMFAHWVWGGGWLSALGTQFGLGRGFVDPGGAGVVHVVGGLSALSIAWTLGARQGKFTSGGMPMAVPGHNAVFVVFGCVLSLLGWLGMNAAGMMLFASLAPGVVPLIFLNTILCASAALVAAFVITRSRFGKPDASLMTNGWIGGLVTSSAVSGFTTPAGAALMGAVAGALVVFAVELFEVYLGADDPAGSISVHAIGGIWGILAVGWFCRVPFQLGSLPGQFLSQVVGAATLIGVVLPVSYTLTWLINRFSPHRIDLDGEQQGLDRSELGADAYPEFLVHTEDFIPR